MVNKKHLGIGVILLMSAKGTTTLALAFLLPTWPLRIAALIVIILIILMAVLRHRRKRKYVDSSAGTE